MRDGALVFSSGSQQMREQEAGEIIHGKPQFVTVNAGLPRRPLVLRADPGIADEEVEPAVIGEHGFRQLPCPRPATDRSA